MHRYFWMAVNREKQWLCKRKAWFVAVKRCQCERPFRDCTMASRSLASRWHTNMYQSHRRNKSQFTDPEGIAFSGKRLWTSQTSIRSAKKAITHTAQAVMNNSAALTSPRTALWVCVSHSSLETPLTLRGVRVMIYLLRAQKHSVTKHEGCVQNRAEHTTISTVSSKFTCTLCQFSVHDPMHLIKCATGAHCMKYCNCTMPMFLNLFDSKGPHCPQPYLKTIKPKFCFTKCFLIYVNSWFLKIKKHLK